MSSAKAEIANYSTSTSFGRGKRITHDVRWKRPKTRGDALEQIKATYLHNRWKAIEQTANSRMLGLEIKPDLIDYSNGELKRILDDMERYRMIIYED